MPAKKALVDRMVQYLFDNCNETDVLCALGENEAFARCINIYLYNMFDKLFHDKNHSASPEGTDILEESPEFVEFWSKIHDSHDNISGSSFSVIRRIEVGFRDAIGFIKRVHLNGTWYYAVDRLSTFKYLNSIGRDDDGCGCIMMPKIDYDVSQARHKALLERFKLSEEMIRDIIDKIHNCVEKSYMIESSLSDVKADELSVRAGKKRHSVKTNVRIAISYAIDDVKGELKTTDPNYYYIDEYLTAVKLCEFEEFDFICNYAL